MHGEGSWRPSQATKRESVIFTFRVLSRYGELCMSVHTLFVGQCQTRSAGFLLIDFEKKILRSTFDFIEHKSHKNINVTIHLTQMLTIPYLCIDLDKMHLMPV